MSGFKQLNASDVESVESEIFLQPSHTGLLTAYVSLSIELRQMSHKAEQKGQNHRLHDKPTMYSWKFFSDN